MSDPVNILLIDDQPAKLLSYEVILEGLGENLIKAGSGQEALTCLLRTEVALILIDVCMPELNGFDLARMLRQHPRFEKTPIIFISAIHLSEADCVRGYETGAVDYVAVPVVPEILRAKVRVFVELYRKTRELQQLNGELERRVSERTAALADSAKQLRESEERLRLASEAAGFGTYDHNVLAGQLYWSPGLKRMVGMAEDEPITLESALTFIHPDHREAVRARLLGGGAVGMGRYEHEFKVVRADGEIRWFLDRGQALSLPEAPEPNRHFMGTVLDITERKLAEQRQQLLMGELDHRVKNILGNVSAAAHLSSRRATSVESFVGTLDGRIRAIAQAHSLLRRGTWDGADLLELANEVLSPFRSSTEDNVAIYGNSIWIAPALTQSLVLILHELATNAVKHGALSVPAGQVRIAWTVAGRPSEAALRLVWRERGGPPIKEIGAKGFGLTILQTAASDIGAIADCDFGGDGFVYTLEVPFKSKAEWLGSGKEAPQALDDGSDAGASAPSRVLVIEDEALVALQLQTDLEANGHRVIGPARSLAEGLSLSERDDIDAALIDISLNGELSLPIADRLAARGIPFAFATGYAEISMLPAHLRDVPRLNKPYAAADVRRVLDALVNGAAPAPPAPADTETLGRLTQPTLG